MNFPILDKIFSCGKVGRSLNGPKTFQICKKNKTKRAPFTTISFPKRMVPNISFISSMGIQQSCCKYHIHVQFFLKSASIHINPSELISLGIKEWFIEKDDIPKGNRTSTLICTEKLMNLPKQVGHFTAMIHEYATAIGCAIVYAKSGTDSRKSYAEYYYCKI